MHDFIETLEIEFSRQSDPTIAAGQKAYMRNQFEYFGLKSTIRKEIQRPFLEKTYLPPHPELNGLVKALWKKQQREYQYFGQELTFRYVKQIAPNDIKLYEWMVTNKSWWDTVDFIAVKLMGAYFQRFPEQIPNYIPKWLNSEDIWLQRSALLFQLKYKKKVDLLLLDESIHALLGSKEFFINKAIGWVLREYSRTHATWVTDFVERTRLAPLSRREALRILTASNEKPHR